MDDLFAPRRQTMRDHIDALSPLGRIMAYAAIAAACVAALAFGSWYMRGLAVPALIVIAVIYKLAVPGKAASRHAIVLFRVWVLLLAFFTVGVLMDPLVRWVGTVIAAAAWFLLNPPTGRAKGPGSL